MIRSHLVDVFLSSAWYLHGPVYDRLSGLLQAHLLGNKAVWRQAMDEDAVDSAPEPCCDTEAEADSLIGDVAMIDVRGVLAMHADMVNGSCMPRGRSYESIINQLQVAIADPAVKQIVLRLETPGGHAPGCQECYDAIRAADAVKPVYAFLTGYCFSAGIYLASACRTITVVSGTTEIGSIGTIWSTWDSSSAAEMEGLKKIVIRAGDFKALIQDGEPVSKTAIAEEQRIVDAFGAAFHDAVRAGRGLSDDQAAAVCNGRTWFADEAKDLGLVDAIAPFPVFIAGITGPEPAMFFGKKKPSTKPVQPEASPAPEDDAVTQAVSAAVPKEVHMDPKLMAALAALSDIHNHLAPSLIKEAAKPGATAAGLEAFAAAAAAKAKEDAHTAEVANLKAKAEAATAEAADFKAKLATAEADKAKAEAALAKIKAHTPGHKDPGGDDQGDTPVPTSRAKMTADEKGAYVEKHGADAYAKLPA